MPNGTYAFIVKGARNDSADRVYSRPSEEVQETINKVKPKISIKKGSKQATIIWKKVKAVSSYLIYQATSKSGKYTKVATTSKRSYRVKSLKKGKTDYFKVREYKQYKAGKYKYPVYTPFSSIESVKI